MGKTAVLDRSIVLLFLIVRDRAITVRIIIRLLTLTELFKLFMLTLDCGEQVFTTQLILVGQEHDVELVIFCSILIKLLCLVSDSFLTLGDLLFELRQLVSDRSRSHIITTILNF